MAKKKSKIQKDLFGEAVSEDEVKKIEPPVRKFVPWEKKRSFLYY